MHVGAMQLPLLLAIFVLAALQTVHGLVHRVAKGNESIATRWGGLSLEGLARILGTAEGRLCIDGHVAPAFFLLGAQKSATTNFAMRLSEIGENLAWATPTATDPAYYWKEPHIFNQENYRGLSREEWLAYYPPCREHDSAEQLVGVDATPGYLPNEQAPQRIIGWYGHSLADRLQFMVLLRNPLSRLHSSFHHQKGDPNSPGHSITFAQYLDKVLYNQESYGCLTGFDIAVEDRANCKHPDTSNDPFFLSMYVPALWQWLRYFHARQFVVAPFRQYVSPQDGTPALTEFMATKLGVKIKPGAQLGAIPKTEPNAGKIVHYPALEEELAACDATKVQSVKDLVTRYAGADVLARLIGPKIPEGLTLFGFAGDSSQVDDVAAYLSMNW
eukprot:gb/GFBE01051613.1/.p1 GENE.gb/GFBE01051613.1/~~gb/GFBE01051613.1/.p1  ORF type:complete len:387 (+),score=60.23 gb/GFBE01051613.1/:1-1161(+)